MTELRVEAKHLTEDGAWLLVLSSVFLCNLLKILLPSCSSIVSVNGPSGFHGDRIFDLLFLSRRETIELSPGNGREMQERQHSKVASYPIFIFSLYLVWQHFPT